MMAEIAVKSALSIIYCIVINTWLLKCFIPVIEQFPYIPFNMAGT